MTRARLLSIALFLAACSDETPQTEPDAAIPHSDAATPADANTTDGGTDPTDSGVAGEDAGTSTTADTPITERFRTIAETFDRQRSQAGAPGAALLILENGEITFARGFGSKSPDRDDPVRSTTLFRMGSVNKMLTATALLQLVDAGEVDLEEPITVALPDFSFALDATWAPNILVRHLLTHASGIVDYTPIDVPAELQTDEALSDFLTGDFGAQAYLMSPPGRMYNYANPNFYLAGLIVERKTGLLYREAMRQRVFAPLGMDRTFFLGTEVLTDGDYADALSTDDMGAPLTVRPDSYDNGFARPAGFAFSSVRDLAKFVLFLESGNTAVLSDENRMAMQSAQISSLSTGDLDHYGFGLAVNHGFFVAANDFRDVKLVSHNGGIPGYSADVYYVPSKRFGFIALANTDGAYFGETFVHALTALTDVPASSTPPDLSVDPLRFQRYQGNYLDRFNVGRMNISAHTSSITIALPDVDAVNIPYERELLPTTPENFILRIQGFELPVTFILDENEEGEYFRTRVFVAAKVPTARLGRPHRVDREKLLKSLRELNE
jgi:CubicO group peptidase (beta-lactamase class C family)